MSWDAFQREVLAELGHVLYLPLQRDSPGDAQARQGDAGVGMLARIARAAGVAADELHAHADIVAMAMTVHGDSAAKRALWPRLRALRRGAR